MFNVFTRSMNNDFKRFDVIILNMNYEYLPRSHSHIPTLAPKHSRYSTRIQTHKRTVPPHSQPSLSQSLTCILITHIPSFTYYPNGVGS